MHDVQVRLEAHRVIECWVIDPTHGGMYFDEFEIGQTWDSPARTITETDVLTFAGFSGDYNPLHTDEEYDSRTQFGGRISTGRVCSRSPPAWSRASASRRAPPSPSSA